MAASVAAVKCAERKKGRLHDWQMSTAGGVLGHDENTHIQLRVARSNGDVGARLGECVSEPLRSGPNAAVYRCFRRSSS